MKLKSLLFALFAIYGVFSYQGCLPEVPEPPDLGNVLTPPVVRDPLPWDVDNGTLVFIDDDHLNQARTFLSTFEEATQRMQFEDSIGWRSLSTIDNLIADAEEANIDSFLATLPPGTSDTHPAAWYATNGYLYQPSSLYQYYEQIGVIRTISEADGSSSYELAVRASGMHNVLNERGEVIVGDRRYIYRDSIREIYTLTGEFLGQEASQKQAGVLTNFDQTWLMNGGGWQPDPCKGAGHRLFGKVVFTCTFTSKVVRPRFSYQVIAQRRRFGHWCRRDTYRPICGIEGVWDYRYYVTIFDTNNEVKGSEFPMSCFNLESPLNITFPGKNHDTKPLCPSADYLSYGGANFYDNVKIVGLNFKFKFCGCSNGFSYTVQ
jgi:hypothetical protein